jgi:hypothetical protein
VGEKEEALERSVLFFNQNAPFHFQINPKLTVSFLIPFFFV